MALSIVGKNGGEVYPCRHHAYANMILLLTISIGFARILFLLPIYVICSTSRASMASARCLQVLLSFKTKRTLHLYYIGG